MLRVAEIFYSLQGEGPTQGTPAVFLRLAGCNLLCGNPLNNDYSKPGKGAAWICDTIPVWLKGKEYTTKQLLKEFENKGFIKELDRGAHLIITGGESLLQQEGISEFLSNLTELNGKNKYFVEVETNCTIKPNKLYYKVNQFNCSPKLSNSGMSKEKRYNIPTLYWHKENVCGFLYSNAVPPTRFSIFKFVVTKEEDLKEIIDEFVKPFEIEKNRIWLMPGADTRERLNELEPKVVEWCKNYGFNYSTRMHIQIWDKKTGV